MCLCQSGRPTIHITLRLVSISCEHLSSVAFTMVAAIEKKCRDCPVVYFVSVPCGLLETSREESVKYVAGTLEKTYSREGRRVICPRVRGSRRCGDIVCGAALFKKNKKTNKKTPTWE